MTIPTMYVGRLADGSFAQPGPHVLTLAPTGAGKSVGVLGPAISAHQGPVFAVTSKPDLLRMTLDKRRSHGPVYAIRLSDDYELPAGVIEVRIDPTATVTDETAALDLARMLIESAAVENSGSADQSFWTTQALEPLAALVWAYRPGGVIGGGIAALHRAIRNPRARAVPHPSEPDKMVPDLSYPSWKQAEVALTQAGDDELAEALSTVAAMDARQRDSVSMTMKISTAAWASRFMRRDEGVPFVPDMLVPTDDDPRPTLHVVAPPESVGGVAVCTLVNTLMRSWKLAEAAGTPRPWLLLAVDEMTNSLPLPGRVISKMIDDTRSYRMRFMFAAQSTAAITARWGADQCAAILRSTPSILILYGAREVELLQEAIRMAPQREELTQHLDRAGKVSSTSTQMRDATTVAALLPDRQGVGRLITGTGIGVRVELPEYRDLFAA